MPCIDRAFRYVALFDHVLEFVRSYSFLGSEHHLIDVVDAVFKKRGYENFTVLTGETAFKVI